ncbi:PqqD family protein [Selenomonas sp. KH1T6]|uniref:PqqD family protein n=1 Tax=Selenomonas sp. KH1T6 TaxID=3158784 RepID=UPI0008A7AC49|nr:Coenzyme PQQ synthesis protein D (PqqD) [Selenomonas ruminantium]
MIYSWLKDKKPKGVFLKKRRNENMLIVCSNDLNIFYLNKTATFMLEHSDGRHSVEEIKQEMLDKYDVREHELEDDLVEALRDLQWRSLVVLEE